MCRPGGNYVPLRSQPDKFVVSVYKYSNSPTQGGSPGGASLVDGFGLR